MGKAVTLIAMEGLEYAGFCGLPGRLSAKFKKKGFESAFGFSPDGGQFCNYFRPPLGQSLEPLLKFARFVSGAENKGESFNSVKVIEKLKEMVVSAERGNDISVADLAFLSFLERRAHMRSILKSGAFAGNYVILKGYELSVFAFAMAAGVPFDELLELRNLALGEFWAYPSLTILFDVPVKISKFYLGQKGVDFSSDYLERLSLFYEAAIARLQGSGNYGFVIRVKGDKGDGVVFADILGKLGHYMPIFR